MGDAAPFQWISAAASHVGRVREMNEDACLAQPAKGLWAVADGMGGHALGDFASRLVIEHLNRLEPPNSLGQFICAARQRLQAVNQLLRAEATLRKARIIGSTVVVLLAFERSCGYLWAGDSRLYLYRNGRLTQLTRDHNQIEELRARGCLPDEDAANYPTHNIITRAVGAVDTLDVDEETLSAIDGDMFMLCSDGLSNEVDEPEMRRALASGDCRQASENLIEMALEHGGRDNISAVVVRVEDLFSSDRTVLNPAL